MSDRTVQVAWRISDHAAANLASLVEQQSTSKTGALEYALHFAAHPAGERARAVLGNLDAQRVEQALECWANVLAAATEDNSKTFAANEWCLIADVCNGTLWEPGISNPSPLIAANVEDGHRLDGTGYNWFGKEGDAVEGSLARCGVGKTTAGMVAIDRQVMALVAKIEALDGIHGWAMVHAVQWFWDKAGENFGAREPWWTLAFRRHRKRREGDNAGS